MTAKVVQHTTTITKEFQWDAGHRVWGHEGKCKHVHGHRYRAEVTVTVPVASSGPSLDPLGRVIDFSVLKEKIGGWIDLNWDHNLMLNAREDPLYELLTRPSDEYRELTGGRKPAGLDSNPTAENIARILFQVSIMLMAPYNMRVVRVKVYETPTSSAEYWEREVK